MSSDEMVAEINSAITESLEAEKTVDGDPPEGEENKPEVGEFDVSVAGDLDPEERTDENSAADSDANSERSKGDKESEEGEEAGELADKSESAKTDEVSDQTVSEAVSHGMSVQEARSFKSESQLQHTIDIVKEQNRQVTLDSTDEKQEELTLLKLPELDPEKYDKEVIESFKSLIDEANRNRSELAELRESQGQVSAVSQQAAEAELTRWFDRKCDDLGDGLRGSIGEGSTNSLTEGSKELATRDAIASQMSVLHDGYVAQGASAPNIDDLFDTATRIVLHKEFIEVGEQKLKGKLGKRSSQLISRAGGGCESEKVSPEQETANILAEKFGL